MLLCFLWLQTPHPWQAKIGKASTVHASNGEEWLREREVSDPTMPADGILVVD